MESISFARGVPAPELLPAAELADCARAALADPAALSYGAGGGYMPLREWLAERHGVEPRRVLLTNGSLQGFVLLVQHLLRASSPARVLVEAPTYDRPLRLLAEFGVEIVPVPMDDDGLDVDALAAELARGPRPAFLYTIPTFQNPTGRTLPSPRRQRLVALARDHGLLVLEDDPYGLVRFGGDPPPTLHELDGGEHVAYSSSFSKTVAPGLRVGYLVLPQDLASAVEAAAVSTYITPALAGQATLFEFVRRGRFEPNLEHVRTLLRERRDAMVAALDAGVGVGVGESVSFTRPEGGYFVWLELPEGVDEAVFVSDARAAGVTVVAGADFYAPGSGAAAAVRLAYSFVSVPEIAAGVARLAALLPALAAT